MLIATLRLVRFPNLLVVGLTQWLIARQILGQAFQEENIAPVLSMTELGLLIFATICVTALGYVVNDISDYEIDLINKPDKIILGRLIERKYAYRLSYLLAGLSLAASLYLAVRLNEMEWIWLYPVFTGLLLAYPAGLKRNPIAGNLFVALACAATAGLIWLGERKSWQLLSAKGQEQTAQFITLFMLYAFIATWIREIVKDLEDKEGDERQGRRSLAIRWGDTAAKITTGVLSFILLLALMGICSLAVYQDLNIIGKLLIPALSLLIIYLNWCLRGAQASHDYHQLSQQWKYFLLGGLSILLCY